MAAVITSTDTTVEEGRTAGKGRTEAPTAVELAKVEPGFPKTGWHVRLDAASEAKAAAETKAAA